MAFKNQLYRILGQFGVARARLFGSFFQNGIDLGNRSFEFALRFIDEAAYENVGAHGGMNEETSSLQAIVLSTIAMAFA